MIPFRPLPFLGNPHVQTVLGNMWKGLHFPMASRQRQVLLPDGDRLVIHDSQPAPWREGDPLVILVHGLGGCHQSGYMLRLAKALLARALRVVRVDLRGAGAGAGLARSTYNAACSDDVRAVAADLHRHTPRSPLALVGFSLGGNIVLKLAGEAKRAPLPGLARVAAVAPPIDLERCSALLARYPMYDRFFVRGLRRQLREQQRFFPDLPRLSFPRHMTLRLFDELYTAPRGGFRDALDYYRRASALPLIPQIDVPTYILTAADDPFVAAESFTSLAPAPHREIHITDRGGHLGYLGWDGTGGFRWAERRLAEWIYR